MRPSEWRPVTDIGDSMKWTTITLSLCLLAATVSCASKPKPLVPLGLGPVANAQAQSLTQRGTEAYQAKQFLEAKSFFDQAVKAAQRRQAGPGWRTREDLAIHRQHGTPYRHVVQSASAWRHNR